MFLDSPIKQAKIVGYSLIIMALLAVFSLGYAFPFFLSKSKEGIISEALQENQLLYLLMLIGIVIIIVLDFLVALVLFLFFKRCDYSLALAAFMLRIIYSILFLRSAFFLIRIEEPYESNSIIANFNLFENYFNAGLIIFGMHLFLIGLLMKLHIAIPDVLSYITVFAGICYFILHLIKIGSGDFDELVATLEKLLILPMALGELGLAFWLLLKFK